MWPRRTDQLNPPHWTLDVESLLGLHECRRVAGKDPDMNIRRLFADNRRDELRQSAEVDFEHVVCGGAPESARRSSIFHWRLSLQCDHPRLWRRDDHRRLRGWRSGAHVLQHVARDRWPKSPGSAKCSRSTFCCLCSSVNFTVASPLLSIDISRERGKDAPC